MILSNLKDSMILNHVVDPYFETLVFVTFLRVTLWMGCSAISAKTGPKYGNLSSLWEGA